MDIQLNFNPTALWILNICLAIILFGMALELNFRDFLSLKKDKTSIFSGLSFQFVIIPILSLFVFKYLYNNNIYAISFLLILLCPGGNTSNFLTYKAKGNIVVSIFITGITTLFSTFSLPVLFGLFVKKIIKNSELTTIEVNAFEMLMHIIVLLIIPLFLGLLLKRYKPLLSEKILKIVKPLSLFIFMGFILVTFGSNAKLFIYYFKQVFFLVAIAHGLVFFVPFLFNLYVLKISYNNSVAISMELSTRNTALGLFLALTYFDNFGMIALLCGWWGIWQLVSGFIYALILPLFFTKTLNLDTK